MRTLQTILVPVDFSAPSIAALDQAVDLAEATGAKVYVLHAFVIPFVGLPDGVLVATAEMTSRIIDVAQKALDEMIARHEGRKVVMTPLLGQGDAREVVLTRATELEADLICMGTHGRRGIARALIGSVTESIVRTSPIPVLTVHAKIAA